MMFAEKNDIMPFVSGFPPGPFAEKVPLKYDKLLCHA